VERALDSGLNQFVQVEVSSRANELAEVEWDWREVEVSSQAYSPVVLEELNAKAATVWEMVWKNYVADSGGLEGQYTEKPLIASGEIAFNAWAEVVA